MPIYLKKKTKQKKEERKDWSGIIRAIRAQARLESRIKKQNKYDLYVQLYYKH
jgi:hypothetical protein